MKKYITTKSITVPHPHTSFSGCTVNKVLQPGATIMYRDTAPQMLVTIPHIQSFWVDYLDEYQQSMERIKYE